MNWWDRLESNQAGGPFPRCYDADSSSGSFHLLLEDLSETHVILTDWPVPPTVEACERIVDTWAMFHGFWWRTRAGRDVGTFFDTAALAQITADYRGRYERFAGTSATVSGRRHERSMRARWTPASACSRSSVSTRPIHLATACARVEPALSTPWCRVRHPPH